MHCPQDGTQLEPRRYEDDIRVDLCPRCRGMWLEPGELAAIQETNERDHSEELARMVDFGYNAIELSRQKAQGLRYCPKCNREMEQREYARCSQIMIDVCPTCHGVWLDKGEIEALEVFFENSRLETREIRRGFFGSLRSFFE